jgi:predicted DNA-binding transcriptional regulator AlpA
MENILAQILNELKKQSAGPARLWTTDDIAGYLSLSVASIRARVVCLPSFPNPIIIPGSTRRWQQADVELWAKRFKSSSK